MRIKSVSFNLRSLLGLSNNPREGEKRGRRGKRALKARPDRDPSSNAPARL
jgi:hypothetical protein